jgi:glycosyltransferase involved in cell wall biosynthesis
MRIHPLHFLRVFKNEWFPFLWKHLSSFISWHQKSNLGILRQHEPRKIDFKKFNQGAVLKEADAPIISIVTPSFNQGKFIEKTIDSVLSQNYPNYSYHVQDGGSTDKTIEILQSIRSKHFSFNSAIDHGQANAINIGFKDSHGDIMAWINSDDLLLPNALTTVADFFKKNPGVDVVYGHRLVINESGMQIGRWIMPPHNDEILSWVDYIPQETLFWRRRVWDLVGGLLNENFQFALDWDLILRFRSAGVKFARIPSFIGAFRVHDSQKTTTQISTVGASEMERLLIGIHGCLPSQEEINEHIFRYRNEYRYEDLKWAMTRLFFKY